MNVSEIVFLQQLQAPHFEITALPSYLHHHGDTTDPSIDFAERKKLPSKLRILHHYERAAEETAPSKSVPGQGRAWVERQP